MEKSEQMQIFITSEFEAYHSWPAAPAPVQFLRHPHRHVFKVVVTMSVVHDDRHLEFFTLKLGLTNFLRDHFERTTSTKSCEQFAREIYVGWALPINLPIVTIVVSEDGENGAVYIPPQKQPTLPVTLVSGGTSTVGVKDGLSQPVPKIRADGRCACLADTPCPLGKKDTDPRCTGDELLKAGHNVVLTNDTYDQRLFKEKPKSKDDSKKSAFHPVHTVVRDYCFVGFEAEGKFRGEVVLFVPASYRAKKFGKVLAGLTRLHLVLPTRIYIGAGNDYIRDMGSDKAVDRLGDLIHEAAVFAEDRNEEADDFGLNKVILGIDLEIESLQTCPIPESIWGDPDDRKMFRVISRNPHDLACGKVDAVKCVWDDGTIQIVEYENRGTVYLEEVGKATKVDDPLFDSDIRVNKEFFQLADEFAESRSKATGGPGFSLSPFVYYVREKAPHLLCSPTIVAK